MGALWLVKRQQQWLLPRLRRHLLPPSSFLRLLTVLRPFSTATRTEPTPPQKPPPPEPAHFMADYLVDSCGLSRADAAEASKHLAHLKSPKKPDAVLRLLKEEGLSGSHIRRLVQTFPRVLVSDAKKTLEPKIRSLQEVGFSKPELAQLISANPSALRFRNVAPKMQFWKKMLGSTKKLLRVAKHSHLLTCNLDDRVKPNLSFLRSVGVSDAGIARVAARWPRLVSSNLNRIVSVVERVKSLGFAPGSGMFLEALLTVCCLSQATLEAKSNLLRGFGWSEDELQYVLQRSPGVFTLSEKRISRAMDFLLNKAGCLPSYIARRAILLKYSIDKRLIPRNYVLQFLKKKGLPGGDADLYAAVVIPDEKFVDKFIAPIGENVPELLETCPELSTVINAVSH